MLSKFGYNFVISLYHLQSNCSLRSLKLLIRASRVSLESMSYWSFYQIRNTKGAAKL